MAPEPATSGARDEGTVPPRRRAAASRGRSLDRGRIPDLLREPVFRRFWAGQTTSYVGDQISMIALPLVAVLVLGADAAQMGYLTAAALLPNLLFALHAGVWVDRRRRRRGIMITADLGRAALLTSVPAAYLLGVLTIGQLYAVAFLAEGLAVLFAVAAAPLFVAIVPRTRFVEGNSLLYGSHAFATISGQSAGGLLVQFLSAPVALIADALSFVISAVLLGRIRPAEPVPEKQSGGLTAGLGFIRRSPVVRTTLAATTTLNLFNFMFHALFVLFVTTELRVGPAMLGLALGVGAAGTLLGSAITRRVVERFGIGASFAAACVIFPAPLALVPLAGGPPPMVLSLLAIAEFGSGLGVALLDITGGSIQAAAIGDRVRSRVTGAYRAINYGVRPVGALLGGMLGTAVGIRPTLWIATVGAAASLLWLLPSPLLRMREVPDLAPEGDPVR